MRKNANFSTILRGNETKTFLGVEKFDGSRNFAEGAHARGEITGPHYGLKERCGEHNGVRVQCILVYKDLNLCCR